MSNELGRLADEFGADAVAEMIATYKEVMTGRDPKLCTWFNGEATINLDKATQCENPAVIVSGWGCENGHVWRVPSCDEHIPLDQDVSGTFACGFCVSEGRPNVVAVLMEAIRV